MADRPPPRPAELVSLANSLDDLRSRLSTMAEAFSAAGDEDKASDLFEVERSLQAATRRLNALA